MANIKQSIYLLVYRGILQNIYKYLQGSAVEDEVHSIPEQVPVFSIKFVLQRKKSIRRNWLDSLGYMPKAKKCFISPNKHVFLFFSQTYLDYQALSYLKNPELGFTMPTLLSFSSLVRILPLQHSLRVLLHEKQT